MTTNLNFGLLKGADEDLRVPYSTEGSAIINVSTSATLSSSLGTAIYTVTSGKTLKIQTLTWSLREDGNSASLEIEDGASGPFKVGITTGTLLAGHNQTIQFQVPLTFTTSVYFDGGGTSTDIYITLTGYEE